MRARLVLTFCLFASVACLAQTPSAASTQLPKDPRAILDMAAPFYDFNDASLKPWHLKTTYQIYDEAGNPTEQGTYEYWWASPSVHRSTWTRSGSTHTEWKTADGKDAYEDTGKGFNYFEIKLKNAFLSPLPTAQELDPAKFRLDRQELKLGEVKLPCLMVAPIMPQHGQFQTVPLGLFPTYCFNPHIPALQVYFSLGTMGTFLNQIAKVQGRYVPRSVTFLEGKRQILTSTLQSVEGISPEDPIFTPDAKAIFPKVNKVPVSGGVMVGMLVKKQRPVYPQDAKDARVSGTVVLQATIGRDGKVHELHVVSTPWPSLTASALWSVSQWEYKPYLLNGEPVEVETTVNVIYSLTR